MAITCTETVRVEYPVLFDFGAGELREYRAAATVSASPVSSIVDDASASTLRSAVNNLIETIKDTLVAAGWTLDAKLAADGGLFLPANGADPMLNLEGTFYGCDGLLQRCVYVPGACNQFSLGSAVTGNCSRYFAKTVLNPISPALGPIPVMLMVAGNDTYGSIDRDQAGPTGNNPEILAPAPVSPYYPGWATQNVAHGGYRLSSRVVFGSWDGTAPVGASNVITVEITESFDSHVEFKFFNPGGERIHSSVGGPDVEKVFDVYFKAHQALTGGISYEESFPYEPYTWKAPGPNPTYTLLGYGVFGLATPRYRIIATPFSFCIYDLANGDNPRGNSLFACAPSVDPGKMPALITSRAIIGPGGLMGSTTWGQTCSFALNFFYQTFGGRSLGFPGLAAGIYPFSQPLLATNGKPILSNAYLMAPLDGSAAYYGTETGESTVVGKIWDGLVLSQTGVKGSRFSYDGHVFECVSSQSVGSVSSLWLAVDG